jgi:hypothetical protein
MIPPSIAVFTQVLPLQTSVVHGILIVAATGLVAAHAGRIAAVGGARVAVVAADRLEDADAEPAAGVDGAGIAVVTAFEAAHEGLRLCHAAREKHGGEDEDRPSESRRRRH